MYYLAFILSFLLPGNSLANSPRYIYALRCPGQNGLISSFRNDWALQGENIPSRFSSLLEEERFYRDRIQGRSMALVDQLFASDPAQDLENLQSIVDWRQGVYIPVEGLDLPGQIDGCQVVPLLARVPNFQNETKIFFGAAESFAALLPVDQLFVLLAAKGLEPDLMRVMVGDAYGTLSAEKQAELLYSLGLESFNFRGIELSTKCLWDSGGFPTECLPVQANSPYDQNVPVRFYPGGALRSFQIVKASELAKNLHDGTQKVACDRGLVRYGQDGFLRFCASAMYSSAQAMVFGPYAGSVTGPDFFAVLNGPAVFGADQRLLAGTIDGGNGGAQSHFTLPSLQNFSIKTSSVVEFYSNGAFKSGLVYNAQEGETHIYLELAPNGDLVHRENAASVSFRLVSNADSQPKTVPIEGDFAVLAGGDDCPMPKPEMNGLTLGAECAAVVKIWR